MRLSVIIPAYNEEHRLPSSLRDYVAYLDGQAYDWEIIIVDDGSSDRTGQLAKAAGQSDPRVKLLEMPSNQGKGAAIRAGLLAARGDYRLFLDADNATKISHLGLVWPRFADGCALVIASRHPHDAPGARIMVAQPKWKQALGKAGNFLIRFLAAPGIRDTQCGFKAMTAGFAKDVLPRTRSKRWALDVELIALAKGLGYKTGVIPVSWTHVEESKVGIKGYLAMIRELIAIKFR